jgi:signal transduction histidine kinase
MLLTETKQIGELVTEATHNLRQIVSQLRPNLLNEAGLEKALNDYINKFQEHTQIECKLTLPKEDFEQNMDQSLTIFRILQESLNNVAKHSQASLVTIILTKLNESLLLEICDNGIGFDLSKQKDNTNGLLGIKERALMVGGIARIDTMVGKGTSISVSFPLV